MEGSFGTGKCKYSLDKIMANLKEISESMVSMACLVINAEKILRLLRLFFVLFFGMDYVVVELPGASRGV